MVVMAALLGAQGFRVSITTDWLNVKINGPVVLVTYPGNTVIQLENKPVESGVKHKIIDQYIQQRTR